MHVTRMTITACDPLRLIHEVQSRLGAHHAVVHEQVVVLIIEHYALLESVLQCTIVIQLRDATTCAIEIVTGGGGAGLSRVDFGAERRQNQRIAQHVEHVCAAFGWSIADEQ